MSSTDLALRRIDGNVTTSKSGAMAWFTLPPQRGSFRSVADIDGLINGGGLRFSELVGHRIHLRVTSHPYPTDRWARALDHNTPNPLPFWSEHLKDEQRKVMGLTLADKDVMVGVDLLEPARKRTEELAAVTAAVAGFGLSGTPATPAELEWLLHRSVSLGAPAPLTLPPAREVWETDDLADLTDMVEWTSDEPFARTTTVTADVNGTVYTRHVVVLTLCRMDDVSIPESMEPWMQRADRLPFPVEWSVTADVLDDATVTKRMKDTVLRATSQLDHYVNDHHTDPPLELKAKKDKARRIEDDLKQNNPLSTRMDWWARAAVSGATAAEALAKAADFEKLYSPQLTFQRGKDQYGTAREFIPGEPLANTAHRRRGPVTTFAAAVPAMTSMVGDRVGPHIGETCGASRRAVCWEPWRSMEVLERSGLTFILGGLGAGKTVFGATRLVESAERGIKAFALDPAGRLGKLAELPHLAGHAATVDLMRADPGALNPYWIIGDPLREHFDTDELWERGKVFTAAERVVLANDTLLGLLPTATARDAKTEMVLDKATGMVPGNRTSSPLDVIDALRTITGELALHAEYVADRLDRIANLPQGKLIFPASRDWQDHRPADDDHMLRILTMRGNTLPPADKSADDWTLAERLAVAALTLAFVLTLQHVISRDPSEPKMILIEEVHAIAAFPAGAAALSQLTRDFTRKWDVRLILSTHKVKDTALAGLEEFVDCTFVGRTTSPDAQRDALRVMGVETGVGFEAVLAGLSAQTHGADSHLGYREFVFADSEGAVEKIRCEWPERLREVLNTTATPGRHAVPEPVAELVSA